MRKLNSAKGTIMATMWTDNRIADFFMSLKNEFGKYERRRWKSRRCIEDTKGRPISKYEFDQSIRWIADKLIKKWKNDGLPTPSYNSFAMTIEWVTSDSLRYWSKKQHLRNIAVEVGFITKKDLAWLENYSRTFCKNE